MKYTNGDIVKLGLDGKFDVIVQGCNCMCTMGKGLAPQIKRAFPGAYEADLKTIKGDRDKLGSYSFYHEKDIDLFVVNAYTQYDYRKTYGGTSINVDYEAIETVFTLLNKDYKGKQVGIPKIGAGLAGGDWDKISEIIERVTPDLHVTVVNYVPESKYSKRVYTDWEYGKGYSL